MSPNQPEKSEMSSVEYFARDALQNYIAPSTVGSRKERLRKWPGRSNLSAPTLCRGRHGLSEELDGYGNSVVPQIPELIGNAILQARAPCTASSSQQH